MIIRRLQYRGIMSSNQIRGTSRIDMPGVHARTIQCCSTSSNESNFDQDRATSNKDPASVGPQASLISEAVEDVLIPIVPIFLSTSVEKVRATKEKTIIRIKME